MKTLLLRRGDPMFDSEILLGISQCKGKQIAFFRGGWGDPKASPFSGSDSATLLLLDTLASFSFLF